MATSTQLSGLKGWLVLLGIVILVSPIRLLATVVPTYIQIFTDGSWEKLTTPGSPAYSSWWQPILIGEIFMNVVFLLAWFYLAYLFFSKRDSFPPLFRYLVIASIVFIVADAFALKLVLPNEPVFDTDTVKELTRSLVAGAIWIPYTLMSKRVRATFVN